MSTSIFALKIDCLQGSLSLIGKGFDKQTPGPLNIGQQLGRRVEDHNVEEAVLGQRFRHGLGNQVEGRAQRSHRGRVEPHEEHQTWFVARFRHIDIDEVSKGQVSAPLESITKLS